MLHEITFGQIANGGLMIPHGQAALLVMDTTRIAAAMTNPAVNPFVCAVYGDEADVRKKMAKYQNNPKYDINFVPAD